MRMTVEMAHEGVPLIVIHRQLAHSNLGPSRETDQPASTKYRSNAATTRTSSPRMVSSLPEASERSHSSRQEAASDDRHDRSVSRKATLSGPGSAPIAGRRKEQRRRA
jgi:hypothetical protein